MAESGKYRLKSYSEMAQQAGRIHGAIAPQMRRIVDAYRDAARIAYGSDIQTSDLDRATAVAQRSAEYQRLQRRLNRVDAFMDRNRPNFEDEGPIDIFNPNRLTPARRRNIELMSRRTRRRR